MTVAGKSFFSVGLVSIEEIYQTLKRVFHDISKPFNVLVNRCIGYTLVPSPVHCDLIPDEI